MYNSHFYLVPKHFQHPEEITFPVKWSLPTPQHQSLANTNLRDVSGDLSILDILYEWNHTGPGSFRGWLRSLSTRPWRFSSHSYNCCVLLNLSPSPNRNPWLPNLSDETLVNKRRLTAACAQQRSLRCALSAPSGPSGHSHTEHGAFREGKTTDIPN